MIFSLCSVYNDRIISSIIVTDCLLIIIMFLVRLFFFFSNDAFKILTKFLLFLMNMIHLTGRKINII